VTEGVEPRASDERGPAAGSGALGVEPLELRPRFRHQLFESILGSATAGAASAFLIRAIGKIGAVPILVAIGSVITVCCLALYALRFRYGAPNSMRIDARGIRVERKVGGDGLAWDEIRRARHRARNGLRWELRTSEKGPPALTLRNDGLSMKEWERVSERIEHELRRRGVEVETDAVVRMLRAR